MSAPLPPSQDPNAWPALLPRAPPTSDVPSRLSDPTGPPSVPGATRTNPLHPQHLQQPQPVPPSSIPQFQGQAQMPPPPPPPFANLQAATDASTGAYIPFQAPSAHPYSSPAAYPLIQPPIFPPTHHVPHLPPPLPPGRPQPGFVHQGMHPQSHRFAGPPPGNYLGPHAFHTSASNQQPQLHAPALSGPHWQARHPAFTPSMNVSAPNTSSKTTFADPSAPSPDADTANRPRTGSSIWADSTYAASITPATSASQLSETPTHSIAESAHGQSKGDAMLEERARESEEPVRLDKYASIYVPSWLRAVNADPNFDLVPMPYTAPIDFYAYASTFLPRPLLESVDDRSDLSEIPTDDMSDDESEEDGGKAKGIADDLRRVDKTWPNEEDSGLASFELEPPSQESQDGAFSDQAGQGVDKHQWEKDDFDAPFDPMRSSTTSPGPHSQSPPKMPAQLGYTLEGADAKRRLEYAGELTPFQPSTSGGTGQPNPKDQAAHPLSEHTPSPSHPLTPNGLNNEQALLKDPRTVPFPLLKPSSYASHFSAPLALEVEERGKELAAQSLHSVQMTPYAHASTSTSGARGTKTDQKTVNGGGGNAHVSASVPASTSTSPSDEATARLFVLAVPGIREDAPRLISGDLVHLLLLAPSQNSWFHLVLEARVWALRRIEGQVILRCDALDEVLVSYFNFGNVQEMRFNVVFLSEQRAAAEANFALEILGRTLGEGCGIEAPKAVLDMQSGVKEREGQITRTRRGKVGRVLRAWLFPRESDRILLSSSTRSGVAMSPQEGEGKYYDQTLNEEQKNAVESVVRGQHRIPFLISGPPGTGKTKTVVEMTLQILQRQPHSIILLCAPSDSAADTLALRLSKTLKQDEMLRLNDPTRTFAEVPEKLMLYCHINRDKFDLPPWSALMSYRVVVTSTQDASLLVRARCTNTSIGLLEHTILPALRPQPQKGTQEARWKVRSRWTHLILDEAGQGTEAELAPALACVLPSRHCAEVEQEVTIVLCGDTQQLGPTITSFEARAQGLDVSLLERLFDRPVYKESMHRLRIARKEREKAQLRGARLQQQEMDEPCAHLVRNYRSQHPSLLMLPSTLFYSDTLIPCAPQTVHLQEWEGLPNKKMPILFEGIESKEEWIEEGVSWHNPGETARIVRLIQSLTGREPDQRIRGERRRSFVHPRDIAVLTAFREQTWRVRMALRKVGLSEVNVGNVEVYQGAQHRVSILSCVRNQKRFAKEDQKRNVGFMFERKRFNVAITRAQELLIICGNANLLKLDPYWRSCIEFALRNGLYRGPEVTDVSPFSAKDISSLETAFASTSLSASDADERRDPGLFLTGSVVANALRDEEG